MTFPHWLTLLFIGLKLAGVITWSWWLVLLPSLVLGGFALLLVLIGCALIVFSTR